MLHRPLLGFSRNTNQESNQRCQMRFYYFILLFDLQPDVYAAWGEGHV